MSWRACAGIGGQTFRSPHEPCEADDWIDIPTIASEIKRVTCMGVGVPAGVSASRRRRRRSWSRARRSAPTAPWSFTSLHPGRVFERLSRLMHPVRPFHQRERAGQHSGEARQRFATARAAIRAKLLNGAVIRSADTDLRVGKSSWPERLLADPPPPLQGGGRRHSPADVAGRSLCRPGGWAEDQEPFLAHLLCESQYVIDQGDSVFAAALRHFIRVACDEVERRDTWNDDTLDLRRRRLEAELDRALASASAPTHPAGVKWKGAIEKLRPNLFVSMSNRNVPGPTTNPSARCAPHRKITNEFCSQWSAIQYGPRADNPSGSPAIRDVCALTPPAILAATG